MAAVRVSGTVTNDDQRPYIKMETFGIFQGPFSLNGHKNVCCKGVSYLVGYYDKRVGCENGTWL